MALFENFALSMRAAISEAYRKAGRDGGSGITPQNELIDSWAGFQSGRMHLG
jgi:hypothetical protein